MESLLIRAGSFEISIGNSAQVSQEDIDQAFDTLSRLQESFSETGLEAKPNIDVAARGQPNDSATPFDHSIDSFVARFGGASGREILKAAALHLTLVENEKTFSRKLWFARACEAHLWQATYSNQRSRDVQRMISSKEVIQKNGGNFALPVNKIEEAKSILRNG